MFSSAILLEEEGGRRTDEGDGRSLHSGFSPHVAPVPIMVLVTRCFLVSHQSFIIRKRGLFRCFCFNCYDSIVSSVTPRCQ